jgi:hypothetical protein
MFSRDMMKNNIRDKVDFEKEVRSSLHSKLDEDFRPSAANSLTSGRSTFRMTFTGDDNVNRLIAKQSATEMTTRGTLT